MKKLRTVFLGTPEIAVPFLETVRNSPYCVLTAVLSQPDRSSGRGLKLKPSAVSIKAEEYGIPVFKPDKKKEIHSVIQELNPDIAVTCAYGRIIPEETLSLSTMGFLNVHFSLLPAYRGAAPVQRALMDGEKESGVTIFRLDKGMDTGDILVKKTLPVEISDDAGSLFLKMTVIGKPLLDESLKLCAEGRAVFTRQEGEASYAAMLFPEEAVFDFSGDAVQTHNHIRGISCGPRARFILELPGGKKQAVQVAGTLPCADMPGNFTPGQIVKVEKNGGFYVKCANGTLYIKEVKPEGKKFMKASDFLNGARLRTGSIIQVLNQIPHQDLNFQEKR